MAQFGSALAWGVRGRRFKSCHPDKKRERTFPFLLFHLLIGFLTASKLSRNDFITISNMLWVVILSVSEGSHEILHCVLNGSLWVIYSIDMMLFANSFAFLSMFSIFLTSPGLFAVSIKANFGGSMNVLFIFNALTSC